MGWAMLVGRTYNNHLVHLSDYFRADPLWHNHYWVRCIIGNHNIRKVPRVQLLVTSQGFRCLICFCVTSTQSITKIVSNGLEAAAKFCPIHRGATFSFLGRHPCPGHHWAPEPEWWAETLLWRAGSIGTEPCSPAFSQAGQLAPSEVLIKYACFLCSHAALK